MPQIFATAVPPNPGRIGYPQPGKLLAPRPRSNVIEADEVFGGTEFVEGVVHFDDRPFFPFGVWDPAGDYRGVAEHGLNCFLAHAAP